MDDSYDLVILGSGSTAVAAARRGCELGARVAMAEQGLPGGTCLNWGCVPSKTLIHCAQLYQEGGHGASITPDQSIESICLGEYVRYKELVVDRLRRSSCLDILESLPNLSLYSGRASFIDERSVSAGSQIIRGERFLIATGGYPRVLPFPGLEQVDYLTSYSALALKEYPASLIVIGGGAVALELGQMFRHFGSRVTVLEHGERLLPAIPESPVMALRQVLEKEGIEIFCNTAVCSMAKRNGNVVVTAEVSGTMREFVAERLLIAIGTAPASDGIGLDRVGVELDAKGFVKVDERMRTTADGIWAAGDVIGGMMIATAGAREGVVAVEDMFLPESRSRVDYLTIPMAIFTNPEVGSVGDTVASARERGISVVSNLVPASVVSRAEINNETAGVIEMVAEACSGRLMGVHLACHRGAELINEAAVAIRLKATVFDLADTLHVFPSMGEGLGLCAEGFRKLIPDSRR